MSRYPALFSPVTIGHLRIRNRLLSTSHAAGLRGGRTHHGALSALPGGEGARRRGAHPVRGRHRRCRSRTPSTTGRSTERTTRSSPSIARWAARIHEQGAACMVQLTHGGAAGSAGTALTGCPRSPPPAAASSSTAPFRSRWSVTTSPASTATMRRRCAGRARADSTGSRSRARPAR